MSERSRRAARRAALGAAFIASATVIFAQSAVSKQVRASAGDDPDFSRAVREWTTRPEFISPLVDHLPKAAGVPSPKDVLGHHIGEPRKLTYYAEIGRAHVCTPVTIRSRMLSSA